MATNARNRRLEPAYKQHTAVDDVFGVVLDVEVTTGQANEGDHVLPQVDAVAATTNAPVKVVTADQGYAYGKVYGGLQSSSTAPASTSCATPWRTQARRSAASSRPGSAPPLPRTMPKPRASNGATSPTSCDRAYPSWRR